MNNRKLLQDDDTPHTIGSSSSSSHPKEFLVPNNSPTATTNANSTLPKRTLSNFDTSMALTVLVILTALFFMGFFSVYLRRYGGDSPIEFSRPRRRRNQRRRTPSSSSSAATSSLSRSRLSGGSCRGVDPMIVKSLPLFIYNDENVKEPLDCAVCLSEFEERESVKMVTCCGQVFHPECIDRWLASHASCPLCRSTDLLGLSTVMNKSEISSLTMNVVIEERSTVENGDTSGEGQSDELWRMRRTGSWCSSFGDRVCLQRSLSL
ncbi:hypothetical protein IFM89_033380 [Coptis chinensis]|uniref:RING-type E3 ubiquitin transferase n=1 Tax=Coptis chinensis TaxID=261450 RepID=A0A835LL80_9MAGN|nr:hypothetical protein IFM89_033380 [Coptis chinensis]